jgi:hypothetical protein
MDLIMYLLLGHLVGDFALQSDRMAQNKNHSKKTLTFHVSIYVLITAGILWLHSTATGEGYFFSWTVLALLLMLFALHWVQDYLKCRVLPKTKQMYYIDQILHVSFLYVLRLLVP